MTTISPVAMPMSDPLAGLVNSITEAVLGVVAEMTRSMGGGATSMATGQGAEGADIALGGADERGSAGMPGGILDLIAGALAPTDASTPAPNPLAALVSGDAPADAPPAGAPPADAAPVDVPPPPAAGGGPGQAAADNAKKYEGTPYVWGGAAPGGFDCSGLTMTALKEAGIDIPRTSEAQFEGGTPVEKGDLRAGDLVFFEGDPPGHVGIYAGDGMVTHAPTSGDVVKTVPLDNAGSYTGARRYT